MRKVRNLGIFFFPDEKEKKMEEVEVKQEVDEDSDKRTTRESTKAARDSKVATCVGVI